MLVEPFQILLKSTFILLYGALLHSCLVADVNHLQRIQRLATMMVTGIGHAAYKEELQRLGFHHLQRQRFRTGVITTLKIFSASLDVDPNLFCRLPTQCEIPKMKVICRTFGSLFLILMITLEVGYVILLRAFCR